MRIGDVVLYAPVQTRYIGVIVGVDVDDKRSYYWLTYALDGETYKHLIRVPHGEVEWVASVAEADIHRDLVLRRYRERVNDARMEMSAPW